MSRLSQVEYDESTVTQEVIFRLFLKLFSINHFDTEQPILLKLGSFEANHFKALIFVLSKGGHCRSEEGDCR